MSAERWGALMDETVAEVFATMVGLECLPVAAPRGMNAGTKAYVRFSAPLDGCCAVFCAGADAAMLAEAFLGGAADETMTRDTVGELCNMLAGGWKRRLGPREAGAGMSAPTIQVCAAFDCTSPPRRIYGFLGVRFAVAISVRAIAAV